MGMSFYNNIDNDVDKEDVQCSLALKNQWGYPNQKASLSVDIF